MLEKREALLHKKMAAELSKAKEFNRLKNKRAALQCLKKKKLYEQQVENLQNHQLKLEEQVITLEGSKTTAETFSALKSGAGAMKQLHRDTNIDDVDKVMDDINEQSEKMRQVQEALGQPVGYSADLDEDELDAELAELEAEDLEAELALDEEVAAKPVPDRGAARRGGHLSGVDAVGAGQPRARAAVGPGHVRRGRRAGGAAGGDGAARGVRLVLRAGPREAATTREALRRFFFGHSTRSSLPR